MLNWLKKALAAKARRRSQPLLKTTAAEEGYGV